MKAAGDKKTRGKVNKRRDWYLKQRKGGKLRPGVEDFRNLKERKEKLIRKGGVQRVVRCRGDHHI